MAQFPTHHYPRLLSPSNKRYADCIDRYLKGFLIEDRWQDDATSRSMFKDKKIITARIIAKQNGVLAGMQEVQYVIKNIKGVSVSDALIDGAFLKKNSVLMELHGEANIILAVERMILNAFGRLSGIATYTNKLVTSIKKKLPGKIPHIASTRKALWSQLDKRAAVVGGAITHRLGLDDAIIIKHPHVKAVGGSLTRAIQLAAQTKAKIQFFEVEVGSFQEAQEAMNSCIVLWKTKIVRVPMTIMFDNFGTKEISNALDNLRPTIPHNMPLYFEASGGITEKNILSYAKTGVDIISLGALTHSAPFFDVSLRIVDLNNS